MSEELRICLIGCGGTIGASLARNGFIRTSDLVNAYGLESHLPSNLHVETIDHDARSSTEWTPVDSLDLVRAIEHRSQDPNVVGIVVTFGTGTLEETAYLVHLTLMPEKPVVFTAAMVPHSHPHSDGAGNLRDALLVASSTMPLGVYVVLHGEIHDPREVAKVHSSRIRAFSSPEFGPIGCIEDGYVRRFRIPLASEAIAVQHLHAKVELIKCYQGMGTLLIRHLGPEDVSGLVVESLASGQVPPALTQPLLELQESGVQVALSTRCLSGRLRIGEAFPMPFSGDERQLIRGGCLSAFEPGIKARIRLLVGLSVGLWGDSLKTWFEEGYLRTATTHLGTAPKTDWSK